MDVQFGSDIRTVDGTKLGALRCAIYETATGIVSSLVVEHDAFDERQVMLPFAAIIDADIESIEVDLSQSDFDALPDFIVERNIAPPPDAAFAGTDFVKNPDIPDVPPIGAATGVESIAFTPILEETVRVSVGDEVIDHRTIVYATDGEVGRVKVLSLDDDTGELTSLVAEGGHFPVKEIEITPDLIEAVRPDTVVLTVSQEDLKAIGAE